MPDQQFFERHLIERNSKPVGYHRKPVPHGRSDDMTPHHRRHRRNHKHEMVPKIEHIHQRTFAHKKSGQAVDSRHPARGTEVFHFKLSLLVGSILLGLCLMRQ